MQDSPENISVLVGVGHARQVAVLLRKVSHPSEAWGSRLDSGHFRPAMLIGLRAEARFITGLAEGRWSFDAADAGPVRRWVSRQAMRVAASKALRDLLPIAEELADAPRPG